MLFFNFRYLMTFGKEVPLRLSCGDPRMHNCAPKRQEAAVTILSLLLGRPHSCHFSCLQVEAIDPDIIDSNTTRRIMNFQVAARITQFVFQLLHRGYR